MLVANALRCASHAAASTSSSPLAAHGLRGPCALAPRRSPVDSGRRLPGPCRITNTSEEIFNAHGLKGQRELDELTEQPNIQVLNPELGPLERRVKKFYLEELFNDTGPDFEETAYWFHTPPNGWNKKPLGLQAAEEAPVNFPEPLHIDAEATGRIPISELTEGMEVEAELTDMWLYHGCQVDIGAEWDGLIPISQDEWMIEGVRELLMPGTKLRVRIHRIMQPHMYRWPIQLELIEPEDVAAVITHPDDYLSPVDLAWCAEQGWDEEQILEMTGRTYEQPAIMLAPDADEVMADIQQTMGFDIEELDVPGHCEMEDRVMDTYAPLIAYAAAEI